MKGDIGGNGQSRHPSPCSAAARRASIASSILHYAGSVIEHPADTGVIERQVVSRLLHAGIGTAAPRTSRADAWPQLASVEVSIAVSARTRAERTKTGAVVLLQEAHFGGMLHIGMHTDLGFDYPRF